MPRDTLGYTENLNRFLNFAFVNNGVREKIICPYQKCNLTNSNIGEVVYEHLILKPFPVGYKVWF